MQRLDHEVSDTLAGVPDLDVLIARLEAAARSTWAATGRAYRWTFWMRLSWAVEVAEHTAQRQVAAWAARLRKRIPGAAVFVGLHLDSGRLHAHALVFIPRQGAPPNPSGQWLRGIASRWHEKRWGHGDLWLELYRPYRQRSPADPRKHGAVIYAGKEVGTMTMHGTAPHYRPRRRTQR